MQVSVIRVGHALVQGPRGEAGGAPSKNSIWGVAQIGRDLVTFSARVGGTLRFKARHASMRDAMIQLFADKVAGKGMDYNYKDVTSSYAKVYEGLDARLVSDYKAAKAGNMINVRDAAVKAEAPKAEKPAKAEAPKAEKTKAATKTTKAAPKAEKTKAAAPKAEKPAKAKPAAKGGAVKKATKAPAKAAEAVEGKPAVADAAQTPAASATDGAVETKKVEGQEAAAA